MSILGAAFNSSSDLLFDGGIDWTDGSILQFKMINRHLLIRQHQQEQYRFQQQQSLINMENPFSSAADGDHFFVNNKETTAAVAADMVMRSYSTPSETIEYPMDPSYIAALHCFFCFVGMLLNVIVSIGIAYNREMDRKWRNVLLITIMMSNLMALMGENIEESYVITPSKMDDFNKCHNFLHLRLGVPTIVLLLNILPAWCLSIMQQIEIKTIKLQRLVAAAAQEEQNKQKENEENK